MLRLVFVGGVYDGGTVELEPIRPNSKRAARAEGRAVPAIPDLPDRVYLSRDGSPSACEYRRLKVLSSLSATYKAGAYVRVRDIPRGATVVVLD